MDDLAGGHFFEQDIQIDVEAKIATAFAAIWAKVCLLLPRICWSACCCITTRFCGEAVTHCFEFETSRLNNGNVNNDDVCWTVTMGNLEWPLAHPECSGFCTCSWMFSHAQGNTI